MDAQPGQGRPPLSFGTLYPEHDIIAVIDDAEQAHQADFALATAGIPDGDSDVLEPARVIHGMHLLERKRGVLGGLAAAVSSLFSDDAQHMRAYHREAQCGHSLVVVHAPTPAVVERARQVLSQYGAHGMRHYGRFAVADLVRSKLL